MAKPDQSDGACSAGKDAAARAILDDSHVSMFEDYCPYPVKKDGDKGLRDSWMRGWNWFWQLEED